MSRSESAYPVPEADTQAVYIGTLGGDGLVVAEADGPALRVTGALTELREPSALAFGADRRTLYAVSELAQGRVTAVDVSDPGKPVVWQSQLSGGNGPTHLAVVGRYVVTAHYGDGVVAANRLGGDGSVGPVASKVRHPGATPHAHQVVPDPSGRWLLSVDLGADAVFVHGLDQRTGKLTAHSRMPLPAGTGPRHLVFHPDGTRVFVLAELRPEITTAHWDGVAGTLNPGSSVRVTGPDAPDPTYPAEIVVSQDGRFLYATTRGEDAVAVLRVESSGPVLVQTSPTGGAWPRHCALGPDGRWLYVANQHSDTVTWLPRDPATGELGPVAGSIPVRGAVWVEFA
ncbi:lactonase family protein [Actinokineospora enzanensis]|uniref:lactonase family protein n=1 Tax=Actinokineospora enzanensis TaxID=155975 RepID=UPI00037B26D6|nr:lactonase family protein [Actinokineospora enzanensis]